MRTPNPPNPDPAITPPTRPPDRAKIQAAIQEALTLARRLGTGAVSLYRRLRHIRTTEEMLRMIKETASKNEARAGELSARLESLYNQLIEKKKAWETAPPARRQVLEAELKTLLAMHQAAVREHGIVLENQRVLAQVRGRILEAEAYGMAGVTEAEIDEWADVIEAKAGDAENRLDALRDLEQAGRRRERESTHEDFLNQLSQFSEPAAAPSSPEATADRPPPLADPPAANGLEPPPQDD